MTDEKKLEAEELTEEQLNDTSGGVQIGKSLQQCYLCGGTMKRLDEIVLVKIYGVTRRICTKCVPKVKKTDIII